MGINQVQMHDDIGLNFAAALRSFLRQEHFKKNIYELDENEIIEEFLKKYEADYTLIGEKEFGTLIVFQMEPKKESINLIQQDTQPKGKPKSAPGVPERYRWEEIFNENSEEK